jgi:hypothetical protein
MSSSPNNSLDRLHPRLLVPVPACLAPNRAEPCSAHFFSFLKNAFGGGLSGAKIPGRRASLAAAVWNFEQPRPRWVAEHMRCPTGRNVLYCAKGHLFARAELSLCERREPFGNPRRRGCVNSPTTHSNTLWGAYLRATITPPLCGEGTREAPTRRVYASR